MQMKTPQQNFNSLPSKLEFIQKLKSLKIRFENESAYYLKEFLPQVLSQPQKPLLPQGLHLANFVDYTRLEQSETPTQMQEFLAKIRPEFLPAAVCVYPAWVSQVKAWKNAELLMLQGGASKNQAPFVAAVAGQFPHGQGLIAQKTQEVALLLPWIDELDYVLFRGFMLDPQINFEARIAFLWDELTALFECVKNETLRRNACLEEYLKVKIIFETSEFKDLAELAAFAYGVSLFQPDFLKTSTGKASSGASPEAALALAWAALRAYQDAELPKIAGIKVSGGVKSREQAENYYQIVAQLWQQESLSPQNFRIGASQLYTQLLGKNSDLENLY